MDAAHLRYVNPSATALRARIEGYRTKERQAKDYRAAAARCMELGYVADAARFTTLAEQCVAAMESIAHALKVDHGRYRVTHPVDGSTQWVTVPE